MHKLLVTCAKAPIESFDICVDPEEYSDPPPHNCPTMPQIINLQIPTKIGASYSSFGVLLLNDETGNIVHGIEKEKGRNPEEINQEILQRWLGGEGKQPVTWEILIQVLNDSRLSQLAADIQSVL